MFLPAGSQDETGTQIANRLKAYEIFRKVTEERNYQLISTPVVEYAHTFTNKIAGMDLHSMLKWFNGEGEIEVLRPDWTAAVARAIAKQHISCQKWSYQGSVFRMDKDGTESRQAGIEIVHAEPFLGESECLLTAIHFLDKIETTNYIIELGHTNIFEYVIHPLSLTVEIEEELRNAMHNKNRDLVQQLMAPFDNSVKETLIQLIDAYGGNEIIKKFKDIWVNDVELSKLLNHMDKLIQLLESVGVAEVIVDLGRVKNLPYYDGIMFRGFLTSDGSTCFSGGRYDKLYKQFEMDTSAVGLAFDVDILSQHMKASKTKSIACIIATPETHLFAEKQRKELEEDIIDIQYDSTNVSKYDVVYQVIEENKQLKVVRK
ncbi:ATP phosphoribosyltransferase regulatory subunit [Gracilibacillus marinus]|uniref:ATP phosphoribosyltransferase regulatory subunit n=1 Tax=Gracilibacillus marinus TaxID=630535 RepID=A0ABV8VVF5_9BACI